MNARNFLAELKRRNVYKVAVAYAVVGWLVIQVSSTVLPAFHAPEWVVQTLVVLVALGFPIALVLGWAFELTPEGLKRTEDVYLAPQARKKSRAWIYVVIVGALLSVGLFMLGRYGFREKISASSELPAKSIAVLPFENLSDDKANGYFATGMQDEILTRLAGIRDLKVISRSSTEQYASRPPNLKIVAEQLGVATVLEGSVQKAGAAVHINVQLLDARSDSHLWAQSYDRDLKDVFGVQRDVAEKVADALKAQLLPAESVRIASVPTQNPEAYDLYLRANAHFERAYDQSVLTSTEMPQAIALYQQALAKDPGFALAAAMLSQAHMRAYW